MAKNFRQIAFGAAIVGSGILVRILTTRKGIPREVAEPVADQAASVDVPLEQLTEDPGLATLGEVESSIRQVERLQVAFVHRESMRDARSNKRGFTPYPYKYKLSDDFTVADLIAQRLSPLYDHHGLQIVVKFANGAKAMGGTKLRTVRESN